MIIILTILNKIVSVKIQRVSKIQSNNYNLLIQCVNYSDIYFHKKASSSKYFKIKYKFNNYQVWWYDFIYEKYIKIPSSTRYILANYDMDLDCLKKAIQFWIDLIIF